MWICVRSIERDMDIVGYADTKEDILQDMYKSFVNTYPDGGTAIDEIKAGHAEFCASELTAWSNYRNTNYDWKCFWI